MNTTPARQKKGTGCYWAALIVLMVLLVLSVMVNVGLLMGSAFSGEKLSAQALGKPTDEYPQFTTRWSYGHGDTVVVRIPLQGLIMRQPEGGLFMPRIDRVQLTLNRIRAARNDDRVRGIILEVDSPGGAVTPSDEIYNALRQFRDSAADRRIVVFTRDINASGAYYASMAGDWLIAEPTAIVGSIGVMIQSLNWHELSTRIGVQDLTIKSGDTKDILNPFRDVSERELHLLQDLVDNLYDRFATIVQKARNFEDQQLARIGDGRVFTTNDALREGLIDEIGYWDDALARTAELFGVPSVRVVRYERRADWSDWFAAMRTPLMRTPHWLDMDTPRILYLWRP